MIESVRIGERGVLVVVVMVMGEHFHIFRIPLVGFGDHVNLTEHIAITLLSTLNFTN